MKGNIENIYAKEESNASNAEVKDYFTAEERDTLREAIDYIGSEDADWYSCLAIDRAVCGCLTVDRTELANKWCKLLVRYCSMYTSEVAPVVPLNDHKLEYLGNRKGYSKRSYNQARCNLRIALLTAAADNDMQLFEEIIKEGY